MDVRLTWERTRDGLVWAYVGRDWLKHSGWVASLMLFPMPSLMTRRDDGCVVLCGLEVRVGLTWSLMLLKRGEWPKPRLSIGLRSDASEIATRQAALAGTFA